MEESSTSFHELSEHLFAKFQSKRRSSSVSSIEIASSFSSITSIKSPKQISSPKNKLSPPPPPLPLFMSPRSTSSAGSYGIPYNSEPFLPKTGINIKIIRPGPDESLLLDFNVTPPEPILKEVNVLQKHILLDQERLANPESLLNKVVYDSIDLSPFHAEEDDPRVIDEEDTKFTNDAKITLEPWYKKLNYTDSTLIFESRFECGNLRRAIQILPFEYDLICKPDINTHKHTQWYYFSVSNTKKDIIYKFNIVNFMKDDSLYNNGMQPCFYSVKRAADKGIGWRRYGFDVAYYRNHIKRSGKGNYYTATFSIKSLYDDDVIFLAYNYPYSYTFLNNYINLLERDSKRSSRFRRRLLCQTLAGNNCDLLTVTSFTDPIAMKKRKTVVLTASVHSGETCSSWMMHGIIDFLTGESADAKILRDNFIFKLVPMLNPDGVIVGNYRCNLSGCDLNRNWENPSSKLHPTIFYTKEMIKRLKEEDKEILLFTDLHGHSKKSNTFMYGCENLKSPALRLREQVFPKLLSRNSPVFSFNDCKFKIQKSKESAARVVVCKEFGIANSYTLESSFCGADFGKFQGFHFNPKHWMEVGAIFCETILDFCDPDQSQVNEILRDLTSRYDNSNNEAGSDSDSAKSSSSLTDEKKKHSILDTNAFDLITLESEIESKMSLTIKGKPKQLAKMVSLPKSSIPSIAKMNENIKTNSDAVLTNQTTSINGKKSNKKVVKKKKISKPKTIVSYGEMMEGKDLSGIYPFLMEIEKTEETELDLEDKSSKDIHKPLINSLHSKSPRRLSVREIRDRRMSEKF